RIGTPAEQEQRPTEFGIAAGLHSRVDQRTVQVVDPQLYRVLGTDDELVIARIRRDHRALPAHRKLVRIGLLGQRPGFAVVAPSLRVHPPQDPLGVPEPPQLEILAAKPSRRWLQLTTRSAGTRCSQNAPRTLLLAPLAGRPEAADQVGHRIAVL